MNWREVRWRSMGAWLAPVLTVMLATQWGCAPAAVTRQIGGELVVGRYIQPGAYTAYLAGVIADESGDPEAALAHYELATKLDPASVTAWSRFAATRCRLQLRPAGALKRAADLGPTRIEVTLATAACVRAIPHADAPLPLMQDRRALAALPNDDRQLDYSLMSLGLQNPEAEIRLALSRALRRRNDPRAWRVVEMVSKHRDPAWAAEAKRRRIALERAGKRVERFERRGPKFVVVPHRGDEAKALKKERDDRRMQLNDLLRSVGAAVARGDLASAEATAIFYRAHRNIVGWAALRVGALKVARDHARARLEADPDDDDARVLLAATDDRQGRDIAATLAQPFEQIDALSPWAHEALWGLLARHHGRVGEKRNRETEN